MRASPERLPDMTTPPQVGGGDDGGTAAAIVNPPTDDTWSEMSLTVAERELLGRRALADAWHRQTEWEVAAAYAQGWRAGVEHARAAIDACIREAIDPGPDVDPAAVRVGQSAKDVVRRLVDVMRAEEHVAFLAAERLHDHAGGAVEWVRAEAA